MSQYRFKVKDHLKTRVEVVLQAGKNAVATWEGVNPDRIKARIEGNNDSILVWIEPLDLTAEQIALRDAALIGADKEEQSPSPVVPANDTDFTKMGFNELKAEMKKIPPEFRVKSVNNQDMVDALVKYYDQAVTK